MSMPLLHSNALEAKCVLFLLLIAAPIQRGLADPDVPTLSVQVVDAAGAPVEGAIVAGQFDLDEPIRLFGFSDDRGIVPVEWSDAADHIKLYVRSETGGLVDRSLGQDDVPPDEALTVTLPPAARIAGRLLGENGQPAVGVRVRPYKVIKYERGRSLAKAVAESEWIRDLEDKGWPVITVQRSSDVLLPWVETDGEGRFEINSVAADQLVGLMAIGERTAATTIVVRTDDGEASRVGTQRGQPEVTVQPRDGFQQTLSQSVPIVGRVSAVAPEGPVIAATVSPWRAPIFGFYRAEELIAAQTDLRGNYRLLGMPVGRWRIFAAPGQGQKMVAVERRVKVQPDDDLVKVDYTVPHGVTVAGTVTDRETGQPVPGTVSYYAFADNPHLETFEPSSLSIDRHSASVDEQGQFEIQVLPGPGILTFFASTTVTQNYRRGIGWDQIDHHIYEAKGNHTLFRTEPTFLIAFNCTQLYEVAIPSILGTQKIDLVVGEERTDVPLQFTREDGQHLSGSIYYSNATPDDSSFRLWSRNSSRERWREATVSFFAGNKPRIVQARSNDCELSGWTWVRPGDQSATIVLQPAASVRGRVVRGDGTPVVDASLSTPYSYDPTEKAGVLPSQPEEGYHPHTDDDGRFEFVGLPAGLPLTVMIDQEDEARNRLLARHYLLEGLELEAGESRDLGDLMIDELREWKPE